MPDDFASQFPIRTRVIESAEHYEVLDQQQWCNEWIRVQISADLAAYYEGIAAWLVEIAMRSSCLSQQELSQRSGVSQSTISRVLNGKVQPSIPVLCRILAGALVMPIVELAPLADVDVEEYRKRRARAVEEENRLILNRFFR